MQCINGISTGTDLVKIFSLAGDWFNGVLCLFHAPQQIGLIPLNTPPTGCKQTIGAPEQCRSVIGVTTLKWMAVFLRDYFLDGVTALHPVGTDLSLVTSLFNEAVSPFVNHSTLFKSVYRTPLAETTRGNV